MGDIPFPGAELDRIDNNGDYCKPNCQWTSHSENSKKRRTTLWVVLDGAEMCLFDATKKLGINHNSIRGRMRIFGLSAQQALELCQRVPFKKNGGNEFEKMLRDTAESIKSEFSQTT